MKAILALVSIIYLEASSKSEPANLCNKFLNSDIRKKMIILNKPNKKISVDINNDGVEDIVYLQNTHSLQRSGRYLIIDNNSSYLPEINEELEPHQGQLA